MASTQFSHRGWDDYYRAHSDERAWNGEPDAFLMEHLQSLLGGNPRSVLDVASGDGRNTEPFLGRVPVVVATDLSSAALATFARRCNAAAMPLPVLLSGDFLALGFEPAQFDVVICFNAVPHFEDVGAVLAKMVGLLRPGGRLLFNAFTPGDVAFGLGERVGPDRYVYKDTLFTFLTQQAVARMLPSAAVIQVGETRSWVEPDHGDYRSGEHTHEACFFIVTRNSD